MDTICRDYASSISTNRCKALGVCKTTLDCPYVDAPAKKFCGLYEGDDRRALFCDGKGNCTGPVVQCGGDGDCPLYEKSCCAAGSGLVCQPTSCTFGYGPFTCDEKSDCGSAYVCCLERTPSGIQSTCGEASLCVPDIASNRVQVCNPAATTTECASGSCQSDTFPPAGWYQCK
jgi:hypothetical protein